MAVSPVTNTGSAAARSGNPMGDSVEDLMNNFMTLLVAQMQNQDPTNPMDNNQLTSQLTQFQTAAGVMQLNSTVNAVGMLVTSMQQMNATQWVGRNVLIEGDTTISNTEDGNQSGAFSVNSDTDIVKVVLTDAEGNAYTGELKNVKAGVHQFTMDDLTNFQPTDPREIEDGVFTVSYSATNADSSTPEIVSLKKALVESVSFTPTGAVLQLGLDGTAMLGEVYLVE
ncbi:Flagellar basal-body rod modification protein FlgD [Enterobacter cancerogenus]|uniref:flagellar hook assembly protein FlgD n=1 Tax=Enterobacter cancerogenus TaxID=69218 RepID=UPI00192733C9|nr:flagellar hook capping FlgD N-terminal domain-containing protein [Enterobacter cancerogenus]CAD5358481.1 Flagellar basal-body rod modification protein FlgD [Enterobacter cancerogenus]